MCTSHNWPATSHVKFIAQTLTRISSGVTNTEARDNTLVYDHSVEFGRCLYICLGHATPQACTFKHDRV